MDINRKVAYNTLLEIEKNKAFSNIELNKQINNLNPDSPPFVREIVYGVLENKIYLDFLLSNLIPRGLRGIKKQDLTILRMGLYQIIYMESVPTYAAVNECVNMAKKFCRGRDKFINGVLRGYEKKKDTISLPDKTNMSEYLSIKYSYDKWIVNLWLESYGFDKTESILKAGNMTPNLTVRVNLCKTTVGALEEKLNNLGIFTVRSELCDNILHVKGSKILDTVEYKDGLFSVQDEASCLDVNILKPDEGDIVLDICAAPGGKTLAMAELMNNKGEIYAFDIYRHKLEILEKEAKRLGISIISTMENDGAILNDRFVDFADKVLVDGPCSGLGVIRKKPEIKYKEIDDQCVSLGKKQLQILTTSSKYVKAGGTLVYSTCTINKIENEDVVEAFLCDNEEFQKEYEKQLLPDVDNTDGFYICKMIKR